MAKRNNGTGLENLMVEIYKDQGTTYVKQNTRYTRTSGNPISAEIDIIYLPKTRDVPQFRSILGLKNLCVYVECKSREKGKVPFEQYAKFVKILDIMKIPKFPGFYRGEMVTDSYFDNRILQSAESDRIKLIDINELMRIAKTRLQLYGLIIPLSRANAEFKSNGLFGAINYFLERIKPVKQQIMDYMK